MHSTTVLVRRNPMVETRRKSLDAVTHALALHGIWVNEFTNPDKSKGVEYVEGNKKDGQVLATFEKRDGYVLNQQHTALTSCQDGLIEAHAAIFATLL